MSPSESTRTVPVALIGTRGFGGHHLRAMQPLRESGRVELVGVVDLVEPEPGIGAPWFTTLEDLLAGVPPQDHPEVVIVSTPINTHAPLARQALAAGCHVYLEKPPVPSLTDFENLLGVALSADRCIQVGFQARGGVGVARLRAMLTSGELGEVRSVDAYGAWTRDRAYYRRSPWAGKRVMGRTRVADGVATNPLAHSVDVALRVAGITEIPDIAAITTEMRHAHDIEADDTTYLRVDPTADGVPFVQAALTTTSPTQSAPTVTVRGSEASATLYYTEDRVVLGDTEETYPRVSLLENLFEHIDDPETPLLCPLTSTGAFTAVLEATQSAPAPTPIDPSHVQWEGEGDAAHPVVEDVEHWLVRALEAGAPFADAGAPWGDPAAVAQWQAPTGR